MKKHWRTINSFLPSNMERKNYQAFFEKEHAAWLDSGSMPPVSHLSKQQALIELAKKYNLKTLVETGTYLGDMMYAMQPHFEQLYSIELSELFYSKAVKRFSSKPTIKLLNGDSALKLNEVVLQLKSPALFWLDGHYSGGITAKGDKECPVYEELEWIFKSPIAHVIVIDDARLFIGKNDYPTVDELKAFVEGRKPNYTMEIANDSIRLLPK
jgi:hypothetical protein